VFRNVKHNHEEQTIHPCQFPEDLIARIILATTNPGDLVFDPYMGSGTVAVVARDYQRNFIGAELDPKYHQVALRRLQGEPDSNGYFPNLKTLRDYVERTGESIEKFRFDLQLGKTASKRSQAKIYPEEYHLQEMEERLMYEESVFAADLRGQQRPIDSKLNGNGKIKNEPIKIVETAEQIELDLWK
jgi:adenine-specific DNA-methyltransferase